MNKLRMDEHQRIERYILCKMDDDEASEFEAEYLSDNDCLEQLEITKKLYQGLGLIANSGEDTPRVATVDAPKKASNDSRWWKAKVPAWSLAAMLLLALTPSVSLFQTESDSLPQGDLSVVNVSLTGVRAVKQPELLINKRNAQTILSFYIDTDTEGLLHSEYGFYIRKLSGSTKEWEVRKLKLDPNDMLYVNLGTSYLVAGEYEYSITGLDDKETPKLLTTGGIKVE